MKLRGAREGLLGTCLLVLAGILLFCVGPVGPVPEVEYSRCSAVYLPGPQCVLWSDRKIHLWVKTEPGTTVEIRADGHPLPLEGEEVQGGMRYQSVRLPGSASSLEVSLSRPDGGRSLSWPLLLVDRKGPAWQDEIDALGSRGKMREARQRLTSLLKSVPRQEQGLVLRSFAELSRMAGNDAERERYLRQGIAVDHAERCWSGEAEKTAWLVRLYRDQGRLREARQALAGLRFPPRAPAESKYLAAFYEGLLADRVGNYRLARQQLLKASEVAERTWMIQNRWKAEQTQARVLQDLGRSGEAEELFARLGSELAALTPENPCDAGLLRMNWAWSRLLRREAGEPADDPAPMLKQALAELESLHCPVDQRLDARLNLALACQQAGQWPAARQALDQAAPLASQANLRQLLWWKDLEGRTALAENHPERALRLYEKLQETATRALSFDGSFRALYGRARAQLALGQRAAALASLARVDRLIDEQSWHVPAYEGRDTFVAQRETTTRLYLQLLLDDGQRQKAFDLVRHARTRLLRQLTVRDRLAQLTPAEQRKWDQTLETYLALRDTIDREAAEEGLLPGDQLKSSRENRAFQLSQARDALDRALAGLGDPGNVDESRFSPPRAGEAVLAYHPLPKGQGWVGFAATEGGIEAHTFQLPDSKDPAMLARVLLELFRPALERSVRVRVLPYGSLRAVDFHTLPFDGEPLLAKHLVVYGMDLPARSSEAPPGRQVALLVADPQGNLPAARQEAGTVSAAVRSWKPAWGLERLDGTAARAESVRAALPGASLFHYAGHGTFAGFAGWDSVLELADGSSLTLGDLLSLRQAPRWVVLSSCDAGRSSEQAPGEGIGLANAFLLAGSQAVIAATRKVPDSIARDLLGELYRDWQPGVDLPERFQRAQWTCLQSHPETDCASFRLFEP